MSARKNKQHILEILQRDDLLAIQHELTQFPKKEILNALFAAICRNEEQLRWHAISIMGWATARLAEEDLEEARIIMRRLLWSLNEESGGIGWGAPEAMAEIFCCHEGLAEEYVHMLLSYMRPDGQEAHQEGNYLEHETLQRGLLWAAGRLAQCRRELALAKGMANDLPPYLYSQDSAVCGLAARAIGLLGQCCPAPERLQELRTDETSIRLYEAGTIRTVTVGALAAHAITQMQQ
jgi:hypothetical protein